MTTNMLDRSGDFKAAAQTYPAPTFSATLYGPSGPLPIDTISADELAAWQSAGWPVYISDADYSATVLSQYARTEGRA
jgi:hypothetical protein